MLDCNSSPEILDLQSLPISAFVTRAQLAPFLGFSLPTLNRWASEGKGPRITYLENRPRYRVSDVLAWIEEGRK
ncbi:helix-turn-helix transcriptional regulator [Ruegeria sp. SCSIO 43209]|uniref:helix-turn-helix transcriptional regulator n=1 Tax=Ruegeria sp. SCSIO 43209 TaxID=2793010 RepID=UPI00351DA52F